MDNTGREMGWEQIGIQSHGLNERHGMMSSVVACSLGPSVLGTGWGELEGGPPSEWGVGVVRGRV